MMTASPLTLVRRATYGGRKGRRAMRRLNAILDAHQHYLRVKAEILIFTEAFDKLRTTIRREIEAYSSRSSLANSSGSTSSRG